VAPIRRPLLAIHGHDDEYGSMTQPAALIAAATRFIDRVRS